MIKKTLRTILLSLTIGIAGYQGCKQMCKQPIPKNPVTYVGIPREVVEMKGQWKIGAYTQGFRIEFDDYVATTGKMGLIGEQDASMLCGPGMVPYGITESFRDIASLCETIKNNEEIEMYGDEARTIIDDKPYLFHNKKVIFLYSAKYKEKTMEVDRSLLNN